GGGREADDLALENLDTTNPGLTRDGLERLADGRALIVRQVHRDLNDRSIGQRQAERLHTRQAAARVPNRTSDGVSNIEPVGREVDVERHEQLSSANR